MKLIKPDFERRLELAGVPDPVSRPVDIDQSRTGFTNLRTLRIYQFEPGSTIDGHAEEDEVFVVVLAGSVDMALNDGDAAGDWRPYTLSAQGGVCVAYLPPHSAYRLTPRTTADVAYARATPASGRPSTVFTTKGDAHAADITVLLEETTYAQQLRLRLVQINAVEHDLVFKPVHEDESQYEALVHVRTEPAKQAVTIKEGAAEPEALDAWDTAAIAPGERPILQIVKGSTVIVLTVLAAARLPSLQD